MTRAADRLAASHRYCRAQTRRHARSFYFASGALPAEKKRAAFAVYTFCRYADDVVDRAANRDEARTAIASVGEAFDRIVAGTESEAGFAAAFAWAVRRFDIPKVYFTDLLAGVTRDTGPVRVADWEELRGYCYQVASVVGLMMARVFELSDPAAGVRAIELGLAMQLTNIVRDVGEDYRLGRIYLPASEMRAHGVGEADLAAAVPSENLRRLLAAQVTRARAYYRSAELGIPCVADDGSQLTVWLMRHVYAGILDEAERADFPVLQRRVRVAFARKCWLALRAWRDYRRTRLTGG